MNDEKPNDFNSVFSSTVLSQMELIKDDNNTQKTQFV